MPNLTLRADHRIIDTVAQHLDRIAEVLRERLGVPRPNVMLVPMHCATDSAGLYAEFLYLEGPGRSPDEIAALANAIGAVLPSLGGRIAFRGIPVGKGRIVSHDVALGPDG